MSSRSATRRCPRICRSWPSTLLAAGRSMRGRPDLGYVGRVSTGGRRRHARAAIGWPGEVLRRVWLVFTPVQQPPIDATTQITWPSCHYVLGDRIKAPNQEPLSCGLDVSCLIDVLHCHAARYYTPHSLSAGLEIPNDGVAGSAIGCGVLRHRRDGQNCGRGVLLLPPRPARLRDAARGTAGTALVLHGPVPGGD